MVLSNRVSVSDARRLLRVTGLPCCSAASSSGNDCCCTFSHQSCWACRNSDGNSSLLGFTAFLATLAFRRSTKRVTQAVVRTRRIHDENLAISGSASCRDVVATVAPQNSRFSSGSVSSGSTSGAADGQLAPVGLVGELLDLADAVCHKRLVAPGISSYPAQGGLRIGPQNGLVAVEAVMLQNS